MKTIITRIFRDPGGRRHKHTDTVVGSPRKAVRRFTGDSWATKQRAAVRGAGTRWRWL